jgi:hypothetical protein
LATFKRRSLEAGRTDLRDFVDPGRFRRECFRTEAIFRLSACVPIGSNAQPGRRGLPRLIFFQFRAVLFWALVLSPGAKTSDFRAFIRLVFASAIADTIVKMGIDFRLRFDRSRIEDWASKYSYQGEEVIEEEIGPWAKANGYLSKEHFLSICHWKTPRSRPHCESNDAEFIRAVTTASFSTVNERFRIEVLTLLAGVEWPTASVILHFCIENRYPILDFRALWSLNVDVPATYGFELWWAYTQFCRNIAHESGVKMRTLDRALWQFSKENQPSSGRPAIAPVVASLRREDPPGV